MTKEYIDKEAVCEDAKTWFRTSNTKLYNDCVQMVRDRVTALPAADVRENVIRTQADRIRAMSDEELADKLWSIAHYEQKKRCISDWLDWLKADAKEK